MAGTVLEDSSGAPVASARVRLIRVGELGLAADLDSDAGGRFRGEGLAAGQYRIEVSKANYVPTTLHVRIPSTVLVRLVRCGVISGQIKDPQGRPLHGAMVFPMMKTAGGTLLKPLASTMVDHRGQYRAHNLPPGQYAVAVSFSGPAPRVASGVLFYPSNARPQLFAISGGEEYRDVDFTILPNASYAVSGVVEIPKPGLRFALSLISVDQPALAAATQLSEPDGSFRFESIPPGSYDLLAAGPAIGRGLRGGILGSGALLFGRTRVEVAGHHVEDISLSVREGRSVRFVLRTAVSQLAASPCPSTVVLTLSPLEDWGVRLERRVEVTVATERMIERLAPSRFHVAVTKLGDACYPVTDILDFSGVLDSSPVTVLLAAAGSIRGRLTSGSAQPSDFSVVLVASESMDGSQPVRLTFPDADSRFAFGGLRPGRYRIAARPAHESSARWVPDVRRMFEIEVPGGAPAHVELPASVAKDASP